MSGNRYPGVYRRGKTWSFRAQFGDGDDRWGVSGGGYDTAADASRARGKAIEEAQALRDRGTGSKVDLNVTLAEYLDSWVTAHTRTLKPSTASAYRDRADTIARLPRAKRRLRGLTEEDVRLLVGDILDSGNKHGTVTGKVSVLRMALATAVRSGLLQSNPLDGLKVSRTEEKFEGEAWTGDQARKFLAHRRLAEDPLYPVWHLAIVTGLRRGELHGLKRQDLDLDRAVLYVRRQRVNIRGQVHEASPKTLSSEDAVHLDAGTVDLLRRHTWTSEYLVNDPRTGRPYRRLDTFDRAFDRATENAGLPRIRFHDLRSTSAGLLGEAGVPLHQAMKRLRHWSPSMTLHYQRASGNHGAADAARAIGDLLNPPGA